MYSANAPQGEIRGIQARRYLQKPSAGGCKYELPNESKSSTRVLELARPAFI